MAVALSDAAMQCGKERKRTKLRIARRAVGTRMVARLGVTVNRKREREGKRDGKSYDGGYVRLIEPGLHVAFMLLCVCALTCLAQKI